MACEAWSTKTSYTKGHFNKNENAFDENALNFCESCQIGEMYRLPFKLANQAGSHQLQTVNRMSGADLYPIYRMLSLLYFFYILFYQVHMDLSYENKI